MIVADINLYVFLFARSHNQISLYNLCFELILLTEERLDIDRLAPCLPKTATLPTGDAKKMRRKLSMN